VSVAKPTLEYVKSIRVNRSLSQTTSAFVRLLGYHRPFLRYFVVILAMSAVRAYVFALEPIYTAQIIDQVVTQGNYDLLLPLVLAILFVTGLFAVLNYAVTFLQAYSAQLIERDIRTDYYSSLEHMPFGFYDSAMVGDLVSRATMDLRQLEQFLRTWTGVTSNTIFTAIILFSVMYSRNPTMTLLAFAPMLIAFYLNTQLFTQTMPLFRKMQLVIGRLGAYIQQNIIGMKVVRIFKREGEMEQGFKQVEAIYVDTAISAGKIQSKYMPSGPAILTLGITMIYLYGGSLMMSPSSILTIGDILLFSRYMMRMTFPLRDLSMLIGTWINSSSSLERAYGIMDLPKEAVERPDAKDRPITRGQVEFKGVYFGYVKDKPILKNVSFTAKPGERIAILGSTGSGKTSLIYLIPHFYSVDSGSIMIDGIDVAGYKTASLRRQIGIVMQDVFLFTGTIGENIAFGRPDASKDEITSAAKLARIDDFIEELPEGYDTIVGERGLNLSGGQKQRLTIARALVTNPKILILDDSLSFVDAKTESQIQEAIEEAMKGRTCFMIAQRLSTIKNADRIMVLDEGEVVEIGTHDELMARNGIYKRIYETQFLEKTPEEILQADDR
jgi:ABC-type multidrug transport system fused ATPase/permease subunit